MAILPGKRLGPYEIHSAVRAGGMGEVYRARDTRLDRIVAIKVLPQEFARAPRFADLLRRMNLQSSPSNGEKEPTCGSGKL